GGPDADPGRRPGRIDAARLSLVRELDARGWAAAVGATSTQAWLAQALRVDPRVAAADVRAARALDPAAEQTPEVGMPVLSGSARSDDDPTLPATGRALTDGEVSRAHADAVLASVRGLPQHPHGETRADLTSRVERWLLEQCAVFDPATVRRLGREVLHAVDPTGVLAEELAAAARDELWITPTPTGRVRLRGEVDQVTGALLTTLVEAGAAPRPTAADGPDTRPASTRRAHALSEVLRLAANAAPTVHGGLSPHLLITMTLDTLRTVGTVPEGGAHDGGESSGAQSAHVHGGGAHGSGAAADPRVAEHPALFGPPKPTQAGTTTCSHGRTGPGIASGTAVGTAAGTAAGTTGGTAAGTAGGTPTGGAAGAGAVAGAQTGLAKGTAAGPDPDEAPLSRAERRAAPRVARRMAVTETGVPLSAGLARRLACDATVIPMVLGSASEPLDVGRATRLIPPAIRRALIARDRGCAFPGCRRPPRWCDAHHIQHWSEGGPTSLVNLVLLCDFHHDVIHHGQWTVTITDGRPLFTPPAWLDPTRSPRGPTDPQAA
ncbi:MAG TPA: DUF222 domain-containing protein, partial [Actinomycetales bacterium]|nr:DUF222 domain-containing protein [Actinomycetales bacterium]